jgi:ribonuclease Y
MEAPILYIVLAIAVGAALGFGLSLVYKKSLKTQWDVLGRERDHVLEEARREAEGIKKEAAVSAKDFAYQAKVESEREIKERMRELNQLDKRLRQKEETIEKKVEQFERREHEFSKKEREFQSRERGLAEKEGEVSRLVKEQRDVLEGIAKLSSEEARQELFARVEQETRYEAAKLSKRIEDEAKDEAEKKAKHIVSLAIQRYASDYVADATVSAVSLPNDEMKGRIIGREGRNIRAFEAVSGVELIVDDTPEVVTLSAHDPVRREVARIALERLVGDGRIHPARIEEIVEKVRKEIDAAIREEGEKTIFDLGISGVHPDIIKLIGRLRYRSSYGQNVLQHSREVAYLAGMMAGELGVDTKLAKRAGLLHDIGKAVDHEMEGSHQDIGAVLAKKYGESEYVINAILAHHGDVDPSCVESALVAAGDALSAARPGVRKESIENYLKRLQKLEEIAMSYRGIDKCYAIQAGREIRIIVKPEDVSDETGSMISRDIARKIEAEMTYPGQIKVTVIRESRFVDYAK